ncbi:MAG: DUF4115 domain-containing protein [Candidatus Gracilibacteria bacterium]|nr:DUF4115 domain-containing protein [Candidatus Gracilibacteria bacterium]
MLGKAPSLAEILKAARERQGLSVVQVELETNIRPQYIEALENQSYDNLPADIYLGQILNTYAEYLGLDAVLIHKIFLKERRRFSKAQRPLITKEMIAASQPRRTFIEPVTSSLLALSPRTIVFGLTAGIVLLVSSYVFNLYFDYIANPELEVFEPKDRAVIQGNNVVVSGRTNPGVNVTINGSNLPIDSEGFFVVNYDLQERDGEEEINIVAVSNKNPQKYTSSKVNVLVDFPEDQLRQSNEDLILTLNTLEPAWVSLTGDNQEALFEGTLEAGVEKEFRAKETISLITGNAGGVQVALNGKDKGILGARGEVQKVTYGRGKQSDVIVSFDN